MLRVCTRSSKYITNHIYNHKRHRCVFLSAVVSLVQANNNNHGKASSSSSSMQRSMDARVHQLTLQQYARRQNTSINGQRRRRRQNIILNLLHWPCNALYTDYHDLHICLLRDAILRRSKIVLSPSLCSILVSLGSVRGESDVMFQPVFPPKPNPQSIRRQRRSIIRSM